MHTSVSKQKHKYTINPKKKNQEKNGKADSVNSERRTFLVIASHSTVKNPRETPKGAPKNFGANPKKKEPSLFSTFSESITSYFS